MFKQLLALLAVSAIFASPSYAMPKDGGGNCASCHTLTEKDANELLKKTGINVKSVKQAPVQGLFELLVEKDNKQGVIFVDYGKKKSDAGHDCQFGISAAGLGPCPGSATTQADHIGRCL